MVVVSTARSAGKKHCKIRCMSNVSQDSTSTSRCGKESDPSVVKHACYVVLIPALQFHFCQK